MRHCVASYAADVIGGMSRIFSIRQQGFRIATLELVPGRTRRVVDPLGTLTTIGGTNIPMSWVQLPAEPLYRVQQLKGRCNSQVPASIRLKAEAFVSMINGEDEIIAR